MLWRLVAATVVGSLVLVLAGPVARASSAEAQRNQVASLLDAGKKATLDDLALASALADAAILQSPGEPWGYLARCDIARRIGSAEVFRACLRDLKRVAPDHPETLRLLDQSVAPASGWVWFARGVLITALLGTLGHAAARGRRRWRRRRDGVGRPVVAFFVILASLAGGRLALASPPVDELRCEVAVRSSDVPTLEHCQEELERLATRDAGAVSYRWALAIAKQDRAAALRLIDDAKQAGAERSGVTADRLAEMERATNAMSRRRVSRFLAWAVAAALLAFSLRGGLRWLAARPSPLTPGRSPAENE